MDAERTRALTIQVIDGHPARIVRLAGELDMSTAETCREALDPIVLAGPDLVIDLRGLTFLDSIGLSTLLHAHLAGTENGLRVAFVRGDRTVHRVFSITEMDTRLEWVEISGDGYPDGTDGSDSDRRGPDPEV